MPESFPDKEAIRHAQLLALNELLREVIPANPFYTQKVLETSAPREYTSLEHFEKHFPFTTKHELARDQEHHPLYGRNLTYPLERYCRFHQTSGTSGKPLRWLDTPESWEQLVQCWLEVYHAGGVTKNDSIYFAFSFGPFLGFWLAFDAGACLGSLCIPGGGLTTVSRIKTILETKATVLCCTPSYAIHLADSARQENIDLSKSQVRLIIVAGEPGGSLPATRAQIERLWPGAKVFDHHGMTETGPITYECPAHPCRLHIVHWAYLAEIVDPKTSKPVEIGTPGELVVTTLKRIGSPLVRYRTGDLVQLANHHVQGVPCECGRYDLALEGGILGRTDDMIVVRGVNIYPTAVEQIIRGFSEVAEYQARISNKGALTEMHIVIEPSRDVKHVAGLVAAIEKSLQSSFSLRIPVTTAAPNSLPRAELKAKRWVRK
jgi:phenylacetate-CoA ligase